MRRLLPVLALLLAFSNALAQSNAEQMATEHYIRTHDYDIVHQDIAVSAFNWDSLTFEGSVATTLVSLAPAMDSVILDAGHLLTIASVRDDAGHVLAHAEHGDTLVVHLAKPAAFHQSVRFSVVYHGKVQNGRGLTFLQPEGRPHRPQQIWSQGEAQDNHLWFPTYDFPNDKLTWQITATVPAAMTVVSNGRLVSNTKHGATRTFVWNQDKPTASYLASIVVAPLVKIHDTWRNVPVDYYVYRDDSTKAWRLFHETPDMIDVYSKLTGVDYPWAKYAQTTVADFFGGMENVSATTLVDWLPDSRAYADRPWYAYILIPHELAHQWFGDYTTTADLANMWLNEGFAEFMPGQYWLKKNGAHASQDYYIDEYRQFMNIDARKRMPVAALGSNNIYPRGALVLETLRRHLGDERFWASINRYLKRNALSPATSGDLHQAILDATGQNLDRFFAEWVYAAGYPELTVATSYDATNHALDVTVTQSQTDSLARAAGAFATPDVYHMPLAIRVGQASGADVVMHDSLSARTRTYHVTGVASEPTMVIVDDGNTIPIKKVTFPQPVRWLATQLEHDPDLWDRMWVINALADSTESADAGAALAKAATSADYFVTRAQAAAVLPRFGTSVAMPALARAARDTSAAVRVAAITALADVGGAAADSIARFAYDRDSSYQVQAAAVGTRVKLEPDSAHAILHRALGTTSYRDAVKGAAMAAIWLSGDTTMDDELAAQIPETRTAVLALARLAAHNDQHALDLLYAHLDDPHAYVRNWVFGALTNALPASVTADRFKSVYPTLTHADIRTRVGEILK